MRLLRWSALFVVGLPAFAAVPVVTGLHATPRELLGAERLRATLQPIDRPDARVRIEIVPGAGESFHLVRRGDEWLVTEATLLARCTEVWR
jgi:hypothetical protein